MIKIIALLAVLGFVGAANFVNYFETCNKKDPKISDCLTNNTNNGWQKFVKGYNLKKIPLKASRVVFPNIVKGYVHEGHLGGFDDIVFNKIKIDFENQTVEMIYSQPSMIIHANNLELFVDFMGENEEEYGSGNCSFTDNICKYSFDYDIVERDGEEYMQLKNPKMTYNTNHISFELISRVNKERGEHLKKHFNNYWKLFNIVGEVAIAKFLADGIQPIVEQFLSSIPMKFLFT